MTKDLARGFDIFTILQRQHLTAHLPGKVPPGQRLSEGELVDAIRGLGGRAEFWPTVEQIVSGLAADAREGDVIAVLSNGGFGGIHEKLLLGPP